MKLESLRRCVKRVEDRHAASAEALAADPDVQDIVTLNLTHFAAAVAKRF